MSLKKRGRPPIPMNSRLASVTAPSSPLFLAVKSGKRFGSRTVPEHDPELPKLKKKRIKNTINSRIKTNFDRKQLYNELKSLLDGIKEPTCQSSPNPVEKCSFTIENSDKFNDGQKRNIMAAHYRDQNNKEWEELKLCKRSLLQILKTGKFDNENIYELENIISCFSKFKLCSFCQFVFKKDGLLQHENYCKIKLRSKLYSLPIVETPDEIFKSNIKIFAPIADLIPKTYDSLRECLNEDNYVKTYLKHQQYASDAPDNSTNKDNYNNNNYQSNDSLDNNNKVVQEECQYNSVAINESDRVWNYGEPLMENADYGKSLKYFDDAASKHDLIVISKSLMSNQELNFSHEEVMKETFKMSENILNENIHDFDYENEIPIIGDELLFY